MFEWVMRKKGILHISVRTLMGVYEGAKTRFREDSEFSEEFEVEIWIYQDLCCHLFSQL